MTTNIEVREDPRTAGPATKEGDARGNEEVIMRDACFVFEAERTSA